MIIGTIGRYFYKVNYFTLMGLLAGSTTDPPALAYSNATASNDTPAVKYKLDLNDLSFFEVLPVIQKFYRNPEFLEPFLSSLLILLLEILDFVENQTPYPIFLFFFSMNCNL